MSKSPLSHNRPAALVALLVLAILAAALLLTLAPPGLALAAARSTAPANLPNTADTSTGSLLTFVLMTVAGMVLLGMGLALGRFSTGRRR